MGNIGQMLERSFIGGVVFAGICTGFIGFLYLLAQLIELTRPKKVRLEEQRILSHRLYLVSGRGRIAYLLLCLEETLQFYGQDLSAWEWILRQLWSFTDCPENQWMRRWINSMEKLLPSTVLRNNMAETSPLPSEEIRQARTLYTQAGIAMIVINAIMETADQIVCDWEPDTSACDPNALCLIEKVEEMMDLFGISLPSDESIAFLLKQKDAFFGEPFDGLRVSYLSRIPKQE